MAEESKPAGEQKKDSGTSATSANASPASAPAPEAAQSTSIAMLLYKGFLDWFKSPKAKAAILGFVLITAGLAGIFNYQHNSIKTVSLEEAIANGSGGGTSTGGGKDPFSKFIDASSAAALTGTSTEGVPDPGQKVTIDDVNVFQVVVTLTWTDEPNTARHTNLPDSFEVQVTAPDGRTTKGTGANTAGAPGTIEVTLARNITKEVLANKALKKKTQDGTWSGDWNITVTCTSAGDQQARFSFIGLRDQADIGNAWNLDLKWSFKTEK